MIKTKLSKVIYFYDRKLLVIYRKPNDDYYYKLVNGNYINYKVGHVNSYGHQIILVIKDVYIIHTLPPIKVRIKKRLLNIIEKI